MQVFSKFEDIKKIYDGCVIALGTFDGIHLGHVDIINTANDYAQKHGVKSAVFSFSNHPLELISPEKSPPRLCTEKQKKDLLEKMSVDILFNMNFDSALAKVSSEQFVKNLKKYFSPGCIVVGDNYSYGYLGAGTANTLIADGEKYGFSVIVRKLVKFDDIIVSSTNIRNLILNGDIKTANKLLGREYLLTGKVVDGDKRGRTLGFPTANLDMAPVNQTIPDDGVYAVKAIVENKNYDAVASIGKNPTFAAKNRRVEVHLLDFDKNIYGKEIDIIFYDKIRNEYKFNDVDKLIEFIGKDVEKARNILAGK